MKCLIVSGGMEPSINIIKKYADISDLIIGVDKGCNYLYNSNIIPDYIVGDFDSSKTRIIDSLVNAGAKKYSYNCEKNSTDSELAFELAFENNIKEIFFLGSTGNRFDHTLGNLGLLIKALKVNVKATIVDDNNKITIIENKSEVEKDDNYKYISFLAYKDKVEKLSIYGAKYKLEDYDLEIGDGRTISNEFLDRNISVNFSKGSLLIIYSRD